VLVAQHGKVIYEKYFEGDEETLRDARSATKTITGSLVGIAVHKKKLALDTRVWPLLGEKDRDITVENLLTMSSALDLGRLGRVLRHGMSPHRRCAQRRNVPHKRGRAPQGPSRGARVGHRGAESPHKTAA